MCSRPTHCTTTSIGPVTRAATALSQLAPQADIIDLDIIRRRDLLGGLIDEYQLAA
jgi:hypothetical protein